MTEQIDELLSRVKLIELAQLAGADLRRNTRGEWRGACPIHGGGNKTAFVIWEDGIKARWKCFTHDCGGGDALDFVMAWKGCDIQRAIEFLGGERKMTNEEKLRLAEDRRRTAEIYAAQKREEYQDALNKLWEAQAWEKYYHNLVNFTPARIHWRERGIPDDWQDYWSLGYQPEFFYRHGEELCQSPTITIPIFDGGDKPVNIRHRILKPVDPGDKYRPEMSGLKAIPFMAAPDLGHNTEVALVLEGEIKAAVSYIYLNDSKIQVYGIPGKKSFGDMADKLKGRRVFVLFDPDAEAHAIAAARAVGGYYMRLPMKVDDAILAGHLDGAGLQRMMKGATRA